MAPPSKDDDDAFPLQQLAVLAFCRLAEPIAFTSILAYSFVMVQKLNGTDRDASVYSGLLVSAFAIAETSTIMFWGALSDRIGRKPVVLMGLAGTALSSMIFGFAQRYWVALLARFLGGALNGNLAVLQTMVTEMVKKPEHEPRAYAVQPFMWSFGSIIGTSMGGFFAEPAKYYPSLFSPDGLFGKFPYLLPNLVSTGVILLAMLQGYLFLKETNPRFQTSTESERENRGSVSERTPLNANKRGFPGGRRASSMLSGTLPPPIEHTYDATSVVADAIRPDADESAVFEDDEEPPRPPEQPSKIFSTRVLLLVFVLAVFSFHQMESGTLLPIWLLDKPKNPGGLDLKGGLGFSLHNVGVFMSVNGLFALFNQVVIFAPFVERVGVWKTVLSLTILYPFTYLAGPFLSLVSRDILPFTVFLVYGSQIFFHVLFYPCALILLKNAAPSPLVLGRINGLAMAAACAARTVAPPLGGAIYSFGGSAAALWSSAVVALTAIPTLYWLRPRNADNTEAREPEA